MPQQIDNIKPELILLPEGFGTDIGDHSLMLGFLIPLPVLCTSILPCPLVIKTMRVKRGEPMIKGSLKWSTDHSPSHLFYCWRLEPYYHCCLKKTCLSNFGEKRSVILSCSALDKMPYWPLPLESINHVLVESLVHYSPSH